MRGHSVREMVEGLGKALVKESSIASLGLRLMGIIHRQVRLTTQLISSVRRDWILKGGRP
jgi:hypothetical protein